MKTAIRFYSKFGHTAKMADIVAQVTGALPLPVHTPLSEPVDTLYLGAGVFMGKVDSSVAEFIKSLKPDMVGQVVCFGSSAIIKSPVPQMRQMLQAQGISVSPREFTCRGSMGPVHMGHPNKADLEDLHRFIQSTL